MSLDEQRMRALAFLAAKCRPAGAKRWDEPGILAALGKVPALDAGEVVLATIRAAMNPKADSPGVIPVMTGEHWRERVQASSAPKFDPLEAHERCSICRLREHECQRRWADDHAWSPDFREPADAAAEVAHLRTLIRTETATEGEIDD